VLLVPLLPGRVRSRDDCRPYPAASADRCWVGGLLGGLNGAFAHRHSAPFVTSIHTRDVCLVP